MTSEQRLRYDAAYLLALCASGCGETLGEIAPHAFGRHGATAILQLARRALVASLGAGCWREVRAEAEAKLRTGWSARP